MIYYILVLTRQDRKGLGGQLKVYRSDAMESRNLQDPFWRSVVTSNPRNLILGGHADVLLRKDRWTSQHTHETSQITSSSLS